MASPPSFAAVPLCVQRFFEREHPNNTSNDERDTQNAHISTHHIEPSEHAKHIFNLYIFGWSSMRTPCRSCDERTKRARHQVRNTSLIFVSFFCSVRAEETRAAHAYRSSTPNGMAWKANKKKKITKLCASTRWQSLLNTNAGETKQTVKFQTTF